jgi:transposase InsO family protein
VEKYNTDFPHMSLGWMTPCQFAHNTHNTLLVAA